MKVRLVILLTLLANTIFCTAQQKGCFLAQPGNKAELVTTTDFSGYNAFFIGEFHGVYGMSEVKLAMIRYLNKTYGITDVFMEVGYSAAYLYNSYLETGDTAFITRPNLLYSVKEPDKAFWTGLYEYNKGLKKHITIRGMDFERVEFLKVLKLLTPAEVQKLKEIAAILSYIDSVRQPAIGWLGSDNQNRQDSIYETIRADFDTNKLFYKQYFGNDYKIVRQIMKNPGTYRNFSNRNNAMYQNILNQADKDGIEKFMVFSGLAHANKEHDGSLCGLLLHNKQYKHKLLDIAMTCKNCYDWQQPRNGIAPFKAPYTYFKDTMLMNSIYDKYFSEDCKYTLLPSGSIDDNKVRKYSDYIILMKDQPEY